MPAAPFRTLKSRVAYQTAWFRVERHEVEAAASGHRFTYSYLTSHPSVMVVAVTEQRKIVLIRQYRYPSRRYSYELPGGGTAGSEPRRAALNELREETGYAAARMRKLGDFIVYCGVSDEVCHVFLARGLRPGTPQPEATEDLTVHEVSYPKLRTMIRRGEFRDGMGLAALNIARPLLEKELTGG